MLSFNSKKAHENLRKYIVDHYDATGYDDIKDSNEFNVVAKNIWKIFSEEKFSAPKNFETFETWLQGLPSVLDARYYYNRSAVDDLGEILEETEEEKEKYSEEQAERTLSFRIYEEIKKEVMKEER